MDNQNTPQKDSGIGPIIGSIIIIILIILGGLYFWGYVIDKQKPDLPEKQNGSTNSAEVDVKVQ